MEGLFTSNTQDDILGIENILVEEEEMLPRFHTGNSIYLYATVDESTAQCILTSNRYNTPVRLYETLEISRLLAKCSQQIQTFKPVTLRIALNLEVLSKEYYYDQLTMLDKNFIKRFKFKNIEEYKSACIWVREIIQEPTSKVRILQYTVNNAKNLYNPQRVH